MIATENKLETVLGTFEKIIAEKGNNFDISFLNGLSGAALACFYLGRYVDAKFTSKARQLVTTITQRLESYTFQLKSFHSYCSGMAGVISVFRHLNEFGFYPNEVAASFAPFNELLLKGAMADFEKQNTDFLHGPLGVFYHYIFRLEEPETEQFLGQIFKKYQSVLKRDERGIRVFNSVILDQQAEEYNLGLAHGLSGHLLILAEAHQRGWATAETEAILRGGVDYLLTLEREPGPGDYPTYFPCYQVESTILEGAELEEAFDTRLAWCYGDLDVALALLKIGEVLADQATYQKGLDLALKTTKRQTPYESKVEWNPFFCHGSSGLAYIYQVLFAKTQISAFQAAHNYWIDRTNEILEVVHIKEEDRFALSVLEGYAGLALVLLAHQQGAPLPFKELLLLNL